jgi:hypothetical protein
MEMLQDVTNDEQPFSSTTCTGLGNNGHASYFLMLLLPVLGVPLLGLPVLGAVWLDWPEPEL